MDRKLFLPLKGEYFDQIQAGTKTEEYRLVNDYWCRRLIAREYTHIELTRGYPRKGDAARRLVLPYLGHSFRTITHPHFGDKPAYVFVIDVSGGRSAESSF